MILQLQHSSSVSDKVCLKQVAYITKVSELDHSLAIDDHGGYGTIGNCQTVASSNWQLKSPAYTKRQQPFGLTLREK